MDPFYISTAIPYVNAAPHIGHALEYVQTDAIARYKRLLNKDVFFLSGSDENSLKNVQAAEKTNLPVDQFVAEHAKYFSNFKDSLNISFDDFIRTTEARHFAGAKKLWQLCEKDIYKKKYKGLYCVGCEAFYCEEDLVDGKCPEHKVEPEEVEEENYFFKLSEYSERLKKILESDLVKITPEFRKNEWLAFIDRGLEDFSISRSHERAYGWGVPVPGDSSQIMYVWFDALSNYINALDFGSGGENFNKYWVQDQVSREVVHVIGKGIARFHVIYWLAMLLSADLPLPSEIFIHGYVTVGGEKISKSIGNVIDPYEVVNKYGADAVRYYLLGAISPYQDGDYSEEKFLEFYNAHLANGVGNLTSRILTMLEKYSDSKVPAEAIDVFDTKNFWLKYNEYFKEYNFVEIIKLINGLVASCDEKISEEKPWEKVKEGKDISELLYQLVECLRHIGLALLPIIPQSAEKILDQLNVDEGQQNLVDTQWKFLKEGSSIEKGEVLFPRFVK